MKSENNLSSQMQFIILCCKSDINENDIKAIRDNVAKINNLEEISMYAYSHGVYPLFYHVLMNHTSDLIDKEMKDAMAYLFHSIKVTNETMTDELLYLIKLLQQHDIAVLSFKGPVLARSAYGNIAFRQYGDLDLLVDEKDVYKSAKLLVDKKYAPMLDIQVLQSKAKLHVEKNFEFYRENDSLKVEIHWRLIDIFFLKRFEKYNPWKNTREVHLHNTTVSTLNNELLLVYLCSHGASHTWERFLWIVDIDKLVRNTEQLDWELVENISTSIKAETALLLGLYLSRKFLNTPLPSLFLEKINSTVSLESLAVESIEVLFDAHSSKNISDHDHESANFSYQFTLQDNLYMKVLFVLKRTIFYSKREVNIIDLPEKLFFIYYFLRVGYLLKKAFWAFWRKISMMFQ